MTCLETRPKGSHVLHILCANFFLFLRQSNVQPIWERNHGYATVRNGLTCLKFPVLVHSTIRVCLSATRHLATPFT